MIFALLEFLVCRKKQASLVTVAEWRNDRSKHRALRYLLGARDPLKEDKKSNETV